MQLFKLIKAVIGYPPLGVRQPGVGNGHTGSAVGKKAKLDKSAKPKGQHRK